MMYTLQYNTVHSSTAMVNRDQLMYKRHCHRVCTISVPDPGNSSKANPTWLPGCQDAIVRAQQMAQSAHSLLHKQRLRRNLKVPGDGTHTSSTQWLEGASGSPGASRTPGSSRQNGGQRFLYFSLLRWDGPSWVLHPCAVCLYEASQSSGHIPIVWGALLGSYWVGWTFVDLTSLRNGPIVGGPSWVQTCPSRKCPFLKCPFRKCPLRKCPFLEYTSATITNLS